MNKGKRVVAGIFASIAAFFLIDFSSFQQYSGSLLLDSSGAAIRTEQSGSESRTEDQSWLTTSLSKRHVRKSAAKGKQRKIVHVHVSKTGGNTVREALPRLECLNHQNDDRKQQEQCWGKTGRIDSPLSQAVYAGMHMKTYDEIMEEESINAFLISIRNPITRVISALHPNDDKVTMSIGTDGDEKKKLFYNQCFPSLDTLFDGVKQAFQKLAGVAAEKAQDFAPITNSKASLTECQELAIRVLRGGDDNLKNVNQHLHYNYDFYVTHSMEKYPFNEVFVIRTESLWEDLRALDRSLGGPGVFERDEKSTSVIHHPLETPPTQEQYHQLCCILWHELQRYQEIVDRAENLNLQEKEATMLGIIETCGVISEKDSAEIGYSLIRDGFGVNWPKFLALRCPDIESSVS